MKKTLIILFSVLACFTFISCDNEPEPMSVDEFVDLYNEYLEVEYDIADEQTVKYYYEDTYNLGPKVLVVKLDNGVTSYTIDGVSKTKDEYDNEIQAYKTAHTDWEIIKTSGIKKYRVEKYAAKPTIVVNTKVEELNDGSTKCSYVATVNDVEKVSYYYLSRTQSGSTYFYYLEVNGVEVPASAISLFTLKD